MTDLKADRLIRQALEEDITGEDVSTNAVMREAVEGEVELISKADGVICGMKVYERTFKILDENTQVISNVRDGDRVKRGQLLAVVRGDIRPPLSG